MGQDEKHHDAGEYDHRSSQSGKQVHPPAGERSAGEHELLGGVVIIVTHLHELGECLEAILGIRGRGLRPEFLA